MICLDQRLDFINKCATIIIIIKPFLHRTQIRGKVEHIYGKKEHQMRTPYCKRQVELLRRK